MVRTRLDHMALEETTNLSGKLSGKKRGANECAGCGGSFTKISQHLAR